MERVAHIFQSPGTSSEDEVFVGKVTLKEVKKAVHLGKWTKMEREKALESKIGKAHSDDHEMQDGYPGLDEWLNSRPASEPKLETPSYTESQTSLQCSANSAEEIDISILDSYSEFPSDNSDQLYHLHSMQTSKTEEYLPSSSDLVEKAGFEQSVDEIRSDTSKVVSDGGSMNEAFNRADNTQTNSVSSESDDARCRVEQSALTEDTYAAFYGLKVSDRTVSTENAECQKRVVNEVNLSEEMRLTENAESGNESSPRVDCVNTSTRKRFFGTPHVPDSVHYNMEKNSSLYMLASLCDSIKNNSFDGNSGYNNLKCHEGYKTTTEKNETEYNIPVEPRQDELRASLKDLFNRCEEIFDFKSTAASYGDSNDVKTESDSVHSEQTSDVQSFSSGDSLEKNENGGHSFASQSNDEDQLSGEMNSFSISGCNEIRANASLSGSYYTCDSAQAEEETGDAGDVEVKNETEDKEERFNDTIEEMEALLTYGMEYMLAKDDSAFIKKIRQKAALTESAEDVRTEIKDGVENAEEKREVAITIKEEQNPVKEETESLENAVEDIDEVRQVATPCSGEESVPEIPMAQVQQSPRTPVAARVILGPGFSSKPKRTPAKTTKGSEEKKSVFKMPQKPLGLSVAKLARSPASAQGTPRPASPHFRHRNIVSPVAAYIHENPVSLISKVRPNNTNKIITSLLDKPRQDTPITKSNPRSGQRLAQWSASPRDHGTVKTGSPLSKRQLHLDELGEHKENIVPSLPEVFYQSAPKLDVNAEGMMKNRGVLAKRNKPFFQTSNAVVEKHMGRVKLPMDHTPRRENQAMQTAEVSIIESHAAERSTTLATAHKK